MLRSPFAIGWTILACSASTVLAAEQTGIETGKFGDWAVNQSAGAGPKICFVSAIPRQKEPAGANRGKVAAYVSSWPKEGVKTEVSIRLGYPVKDGAPVSVAIGSDTFRLFGKEDRAYVADPTEELKLVEAMKKGQKLVVQASSEKGTATTDSYSLAGLAQALGAMATACP